MTTFTLLRHNQMPFMYHVDISIDVVIFFYYTLHPRRPPPSNPGRVLLGVDDSP